MKAQNKEEKLAKAQEREKLQREIAAREKAEKMQVDKLQMLNRYMNRIIQSTSRPIQK